MRTVALLLAIVLDVGIFFLLRGSRDIWQAPLRLFAVVNIGLLALDAAMTQLFLRRPRRGLRAIFAVCVVIEAVTTLLWIQLTGTVSSYFLAMALLLIVVYRLFDHTLGLVCAVTFSLLHAAIFIAENLGLLPYATLLVATPGGYAAASFRAAAIGSILTTYGITFVAANLIARSLREKDEALREARRSLQKAMSQQKVGRLSGTVLVGAYELGELLGRGGMGEVYGATRLKDGKSVAVKILHSHLQDRPAMRERFRREAHAVARLPSCHVAEVLELGTTDEGHEFIVMERLNGEDLSVALRRSGTLAAGELVPLVERVAAALDAAHDAGVVHRDLKPQNIFMLAGSDVRLLDFGISRLAEGGEEGGLTQSSTVLGSAGYLAPEQARGEQRRIGPQTDVFALGAILYRALTGASAFPARSPAAAIFEAIHHHPPPPSRVHPGVPTDVDAVVALALAKDPAQRYQRASELARDLRLAFTNQLPEETLARARALTDPPATPAAPSGPADLDPDDVKTLAD
jgi:serine/threonine-protein kinase